MKNSKLKKLVAVALVAMTIATVSPVGASAAWKQDSNGWWNTEGNSYSTGWRTVDNNWYYFGADGYMRTNWVNDGGTWYFMQPSGAMKTGWINDGGKWYFAASSGAMKTGWVSDGGKWYYTAASGAMQTGWVNDGGTWYFTESSGAMATGVVEVDGKVYYLAPSGAMATGAVTIDGTTYNFATSGEAIGDKIPTPTVAFTSAGTVATPSKKPDETIPKTPTTSSDGKSSGGGGGSHGISYTDITPIVSSVYSSKLASKLQNHPTLANKISVTTGNPIVVTLKDSRLDSLQTVFNTAQNEDLSLIEARLSKAEEIMNSYSAMLNVDGVSFKEYLAKVEKNYVASGGNSTYFNGGSFNTTEIAKRIKNNTLKYEDFKKDLKDRVIAMCDETKTAPQVKISYSDASLGDISQTVTKIQRDGIVIYDTGLSRDKNISDLISLGDTTTGTYTVYCGTNYFTVVVK